MSYSLSQSTNQLLLTLVMELKSGNLRRCEALGLTAEEMRMLRELSADDLLYLSESRVSLLDLRIHHENLGLMLTQARREQKRMERIDRALALGASIEMMQRYFGLDSSEVSVRRRLGGIRTRKGRSSAADADLESVLWSQWQKSGAGTPDSAESLDVMMLMAETHGVNLTTIWTLVKAWCAAEKREVT
ncbi:DUF2857 domain-containing protein [Salmonella enterica subsp. enterica serovar Newport]|nr:DUF2857 domain-containing protein [Salmonella enterica]EDC6298816.1 DUF2857 domain-containing protein [Salmonella enterica subsp. enterica serovar Infantis]EEJ3968839.1 DUF2857 domain-containing protein [Salmonella enterica subsp. enterica serovar Gatuni]EHC5873447.1 DUF2857 domain-containing protein [Salmonella enterica subsp. enterica serovar Eastbourne]EHK2565367.1 DUF2857 domain-containing protein [Salmonella enterica subsp. enterica serovar Newport]